MKLFVLIVSVLLTNSCMKKDGGEELTQEELDALHAVYEADSLYNNRFGTDNANTLMHRHGTDLALHAHQNIGKKRRILKTSVDIKESRMKAAQSEQEQRRQSLIERGIIVDSLDDL